MSAGWLPTATLVMPGRSIRVRSGTCGELTSRLMSWWLIPTPSPAMTFWAKEEEKKTNLELRMKVAHYNESSESNTCQPLLYLPKMIEKIMWHTRKKFEPVRKIIYPFQSHWAATNCVTPLSRSTSSVISPFGCFKLIKGSVWLTFTETRHRTVDTRIL